MSVTAATIKPNDALMNSMLGIETCEPRSAKYDALVNVITEFADGIVERNSPPVDDIPCGRQPYLGEYWQLFELEADEYGEGHTMRKIVNALLARVMVESACYVSSYAICDAILGYERNHHFTRALMAKVITSIFPERTDGTVAPWTWRSTSNLSIVMPPAISVSHCTDCEEEGLQISLDLKTIGALLGTASLAAAAALPGSMSWSDEWRARTLTEYLNDPEAFETKVRSMFPSKSRESGED